MFDTYVECMVARKKNPLLQAARYVLIGLCVLCVVAMFCTVSLAVVCMLLAIGFGVARSKSGELNLTEGSPFSLLIAFSIPMILGNLFQQLYNFVDTMIVGHFLGVDALAGVGATGSINFLILGLGV